MRRDINLIPSHNFNEGFLQGNIYSMDNLKEIKLNEISNPTKQEIVKLLQENDLCSLGQIIKKLSISYSAGLRYILELKKDGIIDNNKMPPYFNLASKVL